MSKFEGKKNEATYEYPYVNKIDKVEVSILIEFIPNQKRLYFYIYSSLPDNINPEGINGAGNAQGIEFASLPSYRSMGVQIRVTF